MCWNARGARVPCESLQPFILRTLPRKSWTASACLCVHHPLTRLCNPLKRTGSEDGKRPKPDSCAWVVNLAYPERSFVVILPSWRPPAQHDTPTATFRSCVLPVPVLRSPLILLIRKPTSLHAPRVNLPAPVAPKSAGASPRTGASMRQTSTALKKSKASRRRPRHPVFGETPVRPQSGSPLRSKPTPWENRPTGSTRPLLRGVRFPGDEHHDGGALSEVRAPRRRAGW